MVFSKSFHKVVDEYFGAARDSCKIFAATGACPVDLQPFIREYIDDYYLKHQPQEVERDW